MVLGSQTQGQVPQLEVLDAAGYRVTSDSSTYVQVSVKTKPAGATVSSLVGRTATAVSGLIDLTALKLTATSGDYEFEIKAFSPGNTVDGVSISSRVVTLAAGAANQIALRTPAAGAKAGIAISTAPVIEILDAEGSLVTSGADSTMSIVVTVSGADLAPTSVSVSAVAGVADFSSVPFSISGTVGTYTITYTATKGASTFSTTQQITLEAGAPASLQFAASTSATIQNGKNLTPAAELRVYDAFGNFVSADSSSTVKLILSDTVQTVTTFSATVSNGVATFTGINFTSTVGTHVLQAALYDGATKVGSTVTNNNFQIVAGDPYFFKLTAGSSISTIKTGSTISFAVELFDEWGNKTLSESSFSEPTNPSCGSS